MPEEKASVLDRIVSAVTSKNESDADVAPATPKASEDEEPEDAADKKLSLMQTLLVDSPTPPKEGDIIEGTVSAIGRARVYIDLPPFGTGLLYGREFMNARDILRKVGIGDSIAAKVVDAGNEDGYIELSLKEARQALIWSDAEAGAKNQTVMSLEVKEANKGGLILDWQGIQGFLPASQLAAEHYPRVEDGDKDKILYELQNLVGQFLSVIIITADQKEGKLIFSEKGPQEKEEKEEKVRNYEVGDTLSGEITGVVDFGVFVKLEEGLEGLVHISELDWGLVEDTRSMYKVGDRVQVKVIEVKDDKISLSIKQLRENPWVSAGNKYKKEQEVQGVIIKYNKHGALASIEEGVAGLVHISEFESEEDLKNKLSLGQSYPFTITLFEPKEQRMTLSFKKEEEVKK
ncbi:S1 RNA-binding domain-containing protein [Candidatus Parcubacteria bacterium]|uniref:30S ribosomal protein S1 n=1 Tax=Candidatus Kaiserbacteria bacterium CG10_big_fil_rev_8_21_14_0_10_47_16 TaxID=1974608 RepID=A0A2H0UFH2_9BACT|nr:S1 RNA-binding domain-containing protein [Candidatus Parcubacteria bacterium]PIR84416.1 MAG: 30S ribosomal protein S1 [Candidatus Kaiserbacteria bacterium CG10_big_fil_rev_8_21_14_0_10_47_16]